MERMELFHGLEFDDDLTGDYDIGSVALIRFRHYRSGWEG